MIEIFKQSYSGESMSDAPLDLADAFNGCINEFIGAIKRDENGFPLGNFTVTVTWDD